MMFLSHLLFGILSGYFASYFFGHTILFTTVAAIASALPDIDVVSSKISRQLPPFAIIASLFGHRGIFHSFFIPMLLYIITISFNKIVATALVTGYLSHLLLDALTVKGIRPLAPFLKFKLSGPLSANGLVEKVVALLLLSAVLFILFQSTF